MGEHQRRSSSNQTLKKETSDREQRNTFETIWSSHYRDLSKLLITASGILSVACLTSLTQTKCPDLLDSYMYGLRQMTFVFTLSFFCAHMFAIRERLIELRNTNSDISTKNRDSHSSRVTSLIIILPKIGRLSGLAALLILVATITYGYGKLDQATKICAEPPQTIAGTK